MEDAATVYRAQKGRLGYAGLTRKINSLGVLSGAVFLRAFCQAEATSAAMAARGYTGEYVPSAPGRLRFADVAYLAVFFMPALAVFLWTL